MMFFCDDNFVLLYQILSIFFIICFIVIIFYKLLFPSLRGICVHVFSKFCCKTDIITRFGQWAVVTGGTDGIGKAYARELARRGVNIVIISRNMEKLNAVAQGIERDYGVMTKVIQADFSNGNAIYQNIENQLKRIDVGILVNNVGVTNPHPLLVTEMTEAQIWEHINVNVASTTLMTRMILPSMKLRGRGAIVNLSSLTAVAGTPYFAVYSATKAYIESLTAALRFEVRGTGVHVQTLTPVFVNTNMLAFSGVLVKMPISSAPHVYAKHSVDTLGISGDTAGYWPHEIQLWSCLLIPKWLFTYFSGHINLYLKKRYENDGKK